MIADSRPTALRSHKGNCVCGNQVCFSPRRPLTGHRDSMREPSVAKAVPCNPTSNPQKKTTKIAGTIVHIPGRKSRMLPSFSVQLQFRTPSGVQKVLPFPCKGCRRHSTPAHFLEITQRKPPPPRLSGPATGFSRLDESLRNGGYGLCCILMVESPDCNCLPETCYATRPGSRRRVGSSPPSRRGAENARGTRTNGNVVVAG